MTVDPLTYLKAAGTFLKAGGAIFPYAKKRWRRIRYGTKAELEVDWQGLPISFVDDPQRPYWRSLSLSVTAPKDEEFVIASGMVQVRPMGTRRWRDAFELRALLSLPVAVEKNRQWKQTLPGESVAKKLPGEVGAESFEIRVTLQDHHRVKTVTGPVTITRAELLQKVYR